MDTKHTPTDLLANLAGALDGAFISTWQPTAAWQRQLDEAKAYLAAEKVRAAAPELLKALQYARRFLKAEDHDIDYVDQIIAKARGEA